MQRWRIMVRKARGIMHVLPVNWFAVGADKNQYLPKSESPSSLKEYHKHPNLDGEVDKVLASKSHRLKRPLGPLELMYHRSFLKGGDISTHVLRISCRQPVCSEKVKNALYRLARRHSLLRMRIQQDQHGEHFSFLEMENENDVVDMKTLDRSDWLTVMNEDETKRLNAELGPLWKCILLCPGDSKCESPFEYEMVLLVSFHHSIADTGYMFYVYGDLLRLLDKENGNSVNNNTKIYPSALLSNIENTISFPDHISNKRQRRNEEPGCFVKRVPLRKASTKILQDYESKFGEEIQRLASPNLRSKVNIVHLSEQDTSELFQKCQEMQVSVTAALMAANCLGFVGLLYKLPEPVDVEIPFEFLVDIRRFISRTIKSELNGYPYPGVGSLHVPMVAKLRLTPGNVTNVEFWDIARACSSAIRYELTSGDILEVLQAEIDDQRHSTNITGKSPFVFCLSNLGVMDSLVPKELSHNFKLVDFPGDISILIDDMPIFFTGLATLNGSLRWCVCYCEQYTSDITAQEYKNIIMKYLQGPSKLQDN